MADQDVRVTNMPEGGSRELVAMKIWDALRYLLPKTADGKDAINQSLDLYATCLAATSHGRKTRLE